VSPPEDGELRTWTLFIMISRLIIMISSLV
jgi:hypothetical protein